MQAPMQPMQLAPMAAAPGGLPGPVPSTAIVPQVDIGAAVNAQGGAPTQEQQAAASMPDVSFDQLGVFIRHGHYKKMKEVLHSMPDKRFDPQMVDAEYLPEFGTQYIGDYDRLRFHLNKVDQFGTLRLLWRLRTAT